MLQVNEIFGPTVQGEGKSAGKPVAFLRLANCNLHCIWCDTPHTWNWTGTPFKHPDKYDRKKEVHKMTTSEVLSKLTDTGMRALVISGGEPFLQQKQLIELLDNLKGLGWWVEVETNGTVPLNHEFMALVDQVNCSPKLAHSGDPQSLRIKPKVLDALAKYSKVNFKFVVSSKEDMTEIEPLITRYKFRDVLLMPECQTKEELQDKEPWLRALCEQSGYTFCTRLSIIMSGTKRGI